MVDTYTYIPKHAMSTGYNDSDESDSILSPPKKRKYEAACNSSARLDILESEVKRLKRKVKSLESREKENLQNKEELNTISTEVQEFNGFSVKELKNLIFTSTSIPTATELLLKKLFTTDEIKNHSISGKTKNSKCGTEGPRPPMDQEKLRIMSSIISEKFTDFSRKMLVEKIQNIQKVYRRH
ncbi:unnamed protein product [Mytilus coruscus]|uniref:BEN domain-containing protein n=1 Tax=Mytilus coruscus TaxID=42192 RepID=A0A6J8CAL7_MYTCO|nr:unnamed protein product [Mytilus coruscus]